MNEQTGPHVVLKQPNGYLIIAFSAVHENPIPTSSYPLYTCSLLRLTDGTSSIHSVTSANGTNKGAGANGSTPLPLEPLL